RRADGARGKEHLALRTRRRALAVDRVVDAHGAAPLEDDAQDERAGDDREVLALQGRAQVADGGRAAAVVARRRLVDAGALLHRTVEVRVVGDAEFLAALHEGPRHALR